LYVRGEDDLISDLSLGHPITDDDLRLLVWQSAVFSEKLSGITLVVVGGIDKLLINIGSR
jgi:hypothetical protein